MIFVTEVTSFSFSFFRLERLLLLVTHILHVIWKYLIKLLFVCCYLQFCAQGSHEVLLPCAYHNSYMKLYVCADYQKFNKAPLQRVHVNAFTVYFHGEPLQLGETPEWV